MRTQRKLVNAGILGCLEETAEKMMAENPSIRRMWLDQVSTSAASDRDGGIVKLDTDHDWSLAFFTWLHDGYVIREP
jgi:hypothetical protein